MLKESFLKTFLLILFMTFTVKLYSQDRLVPTYIEEFGQLGGYHSTLYKYFDMHDATFACLVAPSFSGESCLSLDDKGKALKLKCALRNIWYEQKWYDSKCCNPNQRVRSKEYSLAISDSLAVSLRAMFATAVLTSTSEQEVILGCDGITYRFVSNDKMAECWSPGSDTNCGRAVAVIEKLCDAVRKRDKKAAERLKEDIIGVTNLFNQYREEGGPKDPLSR